MPDVLSQAQLDRIKELRSKVAIPLDRTDGAVHKISYWTESGSVAEELDSETAAFLIASGGLIDRLLVDVEQYQFGIKALEEDLEHRQFELDELETAFNQLKAEQDVYSGPSDADKAINELRLCFKGNTQNIEDLKTVIKAMYAAGVPGATDFASSVSQ